MIKYELPSKPSKLTEELQAELTHAFKDNPEKTVWNMKWLKEAVLAKSYGKCCYSDIKLNEESKYMEIDHFFPKSIYPDLVLEWTNLNPSCKTCNASKGDHDPRREPVVNPFLDDPKQYLCFRNYLYFGKDAGNKGQKTIEVLNLNDRTQFVEKRARVGFQLSGHLEELYNNRDLFLEPDRQYLNRLKRLMREGNRKEEYAALTSTIILENECFQLLKTYLESCDLWDSELDTLMLELTFCALL